MLSAQIASRRDGGAGTFELEVEFTAPDGTTTVLVGESGAGKTSILRLLAGLDRPDRGRITLNGEVYVDTALGLAVPPWQREIGYVAQDYALFPHLIVADNVGFGLRSSGLASRAVRPRVEEALQLAGIPALARRMPSQLSGGEQQRVAVARALVLNPKLLLLDEPLSALDLQTRRELRIELRALLRRLPCVTVYVTHSPVEALLFGDQILVLDRGRISQAGSRDDLLRHPRSRYVAELMGTNLFVGAAAESEEGGRGPGRVHTPEGIIAVGRPGPAGREVFVTVSPREITLHRERPEGSAQNVFVGPILELIAEPPNGERVRVVLGSDPVLVAEVTREGAAALGLKEGATAFASFKATGVSTYR